MKFLYHIILYVLLSQWLWSNYCPQFHCVKKINKKTHIPYLTCTLPAMPGLTITAPGVLDDSGRLKRYFATHQTVCDVLGWMNEYLG